ncbi:peroxidase-like protein 3 [Argopecten irradians]|uniref:peroxidase-like protein 3 n=1 Tax=Argopecten irradians TaxID=31199 RepID=UPI003721213E
MPNHSELFRTSSQQSRSDERSDEVPNLLFLHTLMLREHNRIADRLKYCWRSQNPYYTSEDEEDEYIFQETRKIIIAIVQQITYKDFLPKILGLKIMDEYNLRVHHDSHNVYNPYLNPSIFNSFGAAAWRMGHSLIPQLQGFNHNEDNTILAYKDQDFERVELIKTFFSWRWTEIWEVCKVASIRSRHEARRSLIISTFSGNVGDIDLFAGAMTEIPIPGGLLGPTFSCIIGLQFKHLKHGDSFWFERRKMHDKSSLLTEGRSQ